MSSRNNKKLIVAAVIIALVALLLNIIARLFDGFAEWYALAIYPIIVNVLGRISSTFPFSVIELIIITIIILVFIITVHSVRKIVSKKTNFRNLLLESLTRIILLLSIIFMVVTLNCQINYHRADLKTVIGLQDREYTVEQLEELCIYYKDMLNESSLKINKDENGLCVLEISSGKSAVKAMKNLGEKYETLSGYYSVPKGLANSYVLSYSELTGIFSPFTMEANYNKDMPDFYKPFTMCHELSHLKGYMKEEEANFIAIKACTNSENSTFNYSGSALAYIYCINALYMENQDMAVAIKADLYEGVKIEMDNNSVYWGKFKGQISNVYQKFNDAYLKANSQKNGVKSYSNVVGLLLADYYK